MVVLFYPPRQAAPHQGTKREVLLLMSHPLFDRFCCGKDTDRSKRCRQTWTHALERHRVEVSLCVSVGLGEALREAQN